MSNELVKKPKPLLPKTRVRAKDPTTADPKWQARMSKLSAARIEEILLAPHDNSPADLKMLAADGRGGLKKLQIEAAKWVSWLELNQKAPTGAISVSWSSKPIDAFPQATERDLDPGPLTTHDVPAHVDNNAPTESQRSSDNVVELRPREPEPENSFTVSIDPRFFIGPP